jgi:beta-lactamase regulating signal transducer with metallopeptidase domain
MWVWLDRVAPLLLDASFAAAVLTSALIAILLVCRQPVRRIALARTAILGVLAMIPLTALAPWPRFHIVYTRGLTAPAPRQIFVHRPPLNSAAPDLHQNDHDAIAMVPIGDEGDLAASWLRVAAFARRPVRLLVLFYLAVVCLSLAWGFLGYLGIWWLLRGSSAPSPRTVSVFDSLLAESGNDHLRRHPPRLRVSDRVARPVVVALLGPTIVLPRQLDRISPLKKDAANSQANALLRLSLLHELAHVGRHDASFQLVGSLAQSIWFFLPQLWWIRAQLRLDQEYLADHVACRAYGTSSQYATLLLDLAASQPEHAGDEASATDPPPVHQAASPVETGEVASSLGQRLLMLLHCPYRLEPHAPRGWLWTLRLAGIATTFALANVTVRMPGRAYGSSPDFAPSIEGVLLSGMNRFQVSELIMAPSSRPETANRSNSYVLPYQLPAHFSMTLDVLANQEELSHIRLLNRPLAQASPWSDHAGPSIKARFASRTESSAQDDRELWHRVHVERDDRGTSLTIDHHALPSPAEPTNSLIRVEPNFGHPIQLRNLIVTPTS